MTPNYLRAPDPHDHRWMVSYVDILTILLIFFVAAAARGIHKEPVPTLPSAPAQSSSQVVPPNPTLEKLKALGIDVKVEQRGIVISLPQSILFPSGDDRIRESVLPTVSRIAEILRQVPNKVSLEGHADSQPIHAGKFRNNWELASARSMRLMELLSEKYGIEQSRLSIASYGSFNPRSSEETADGRANNRRVEIVILQ